MKLKKKKKKKPEKQFIEGSVGAQTRYGSLEELRCVEAELETITGALRDIAGTGEQPQEPGA
jgi:hypothetical protein